MDLLCFPSVSFYGGEEGRGATEELKSVTNAYMITQRWCDKTGAERGKGRGCVNMIPIFKEIAFLKI